MSLVVDMRITSIKLNMVTKPEEYKWSSYLVNAWGRESLIRYHEEYLKLGSDKFSRCLAYRELFKSSLPEHDIHLIERASEYCQPVGDDRFREQIELKFGIKIGQMSRGRPKKEIG